MNNFDFEFEITLPDGETTYQYNNSPELTNDFIDFLEEVGIDITKLMIVVGMLSGMSLPSPSEIKRDGTEVYNNIQIKWSIENIEDLQQFVNDDLYNREIDQEIGENYYEILEETRGWLLNWHEENK